MLINCELREYQELAVQQIVDREKLLLAVTMGGGKTVISIAALERMIESGRIERTLVVVPANLKYQWQASLQDFSTHMSLVIDGPPEKRRMLYTVAKYYRYIIIGYDSVVSDWDIVPNLFFDAVVIDEATYIKGFKTQRAKHIKKLRDYADVRIGLTGQPVENRPEDLFGIMEFVDKKVLKHFTLFDDTFIVRDHSGRPIRYRNLKLLHKIISPAMFRRSREDIKDELPDVVESRLPVIMSRSEAKLYNIIANRLLERMDSISSMFGPSFSLTSHYGRGEGDQAMMRAQGEIMSMMLALRHVSDDARLLRVSAEQYAERELDRNGDPINPKRGHGSKFAWTLMNEGLLEKLPASSKLPVVKDRLMAALEDERAKLVVFSGFKMMLRYVQEIMPEVGSVIYDGDMSARQKDEAKKKFGKDPNTRLFLSSDAGGYGVDLNMANNLLSIDLPFSVGKFEQRESRIIRLSSMFDHVNLIATTVKGSVEDRIYSMLKQKGGVAGAFVDAKFDAKGRYDLTLSSLTKFLETHSV